MRYPAGFEPTDPNETTAAVSFKKGWSGPDGLSSDGLPIYRETIRICKYVSARVAMEDPATEEDLENPQFHDALEAFKREQTARDTTIGNEGFPLVLWPAVTPAMFQMCAHRNIVTVEQLAALAGKKNLIGELIELADRAKQMVSHSKNIGKFEAIIRTKDGEIEALNELVKELKIALAGRDAMIDQMRSMAFLFQQPPGGLVHGQ
jgi:hypothetical protein